MTRRNKQTDVPTVRCAIYTRKSTEEGLEQEFNSLDAQRDSGEAYIASQKHEGWQCLPAHYDDGGFTGGNMHRPALRRLLADIEAGKIDCVVVYKVDRLSRSLLDFAKLMEVFDTTGTSFCSVTQQFNTATSMGRLVLNVLLSFAQFEREMISERVRDKIAASRRKGKWSGGMPILGYTVKDTKLVVDKVESQRVRQIFEMYLEHQSLLATVTELNRRGWTTKRWTTKKGTQRGGKLFTKNSLYALLTNVTYIGKIKYKDEVHNGEHEAIVPDKLFQRTQTLLTRNGHTGGRAVRNKHGALLRGLLRCGPCGCAMSHTYTSKGNRRYRYYVCGTAQQRGWSECPSPSVPAGEIERFVVDQIKCIGRDPAVIAETARQVRKQTEEGLERLNHERAALQQQLRDDNARLQVAAAMTNDVGRVSKLAEVQERIRSAERRLTEIDNELISLHGELVGEDEVSKVLAGFDQLWEALVPREQARVLELLVERVEYDGEHGNVALTFHPCGIKSLTQETCQSTGGRRMNETLKVTRKFHVARRHHGRKQLRDGSAPDVPTGRVPRIARLMALAIRCDQLIRDGIIANQSELADFGHITTARMTQIMTLLNLAPDVQELILFLPRTERGRDKIIENDVRPIAQTFDWNKQRRLWAELAAKR